MTTQTMQLKLSNTTIAVIKELRQMSLRQKWQIVEQKTASTTLIIPVTKSVNVKVCFTSEAQAINLWATLLKKSLKGTLSEEDLTNVILDLPKSCLNFEGVDLLDQIIENTRSHTSVYSAGEQTLSGETLETQLKNLRRKITNQAKGYLTSSNLAKSLANIEEQRYFHLTTESGTTMFLEPKDPKVALGWLKMLDQLLQNDCLHAASNARLSEGLKNYQMAATHPESLTSSNGMFCCPFEYRKDGKDAPYMAANGFVILEKGERLECDVVTRESHIDDPNSKGYKTWFTIPEGAIFISYSKLDAESPFRWRVNRPRMVDGEIKPLTREQASAITSLVRNFSGEWDAKINYQNIDAFLKMVGNAWLAELDGTDRSINLSDKNHANIVKRCIKRINTVNEHFEIPERQRILIDSNNKIQFGNDTRITELENPTLSPERLERITMAYEIMALQSYLCRQEAKKAAEEVDQRNPEERQRIMQRFIKYHNEWIAGKTNNFMIIFGEDQAFSGVYYLSPHGPKFYEFSETDLAAFKQEIGEKPEEKPAEESSNSAKEGSDATKKGDDSAKGNEGVAEKGDNSTETEDAVTTEDEVKETETEKATEAEEAGSKEKKAEANEDNESAEKVDPPADPYASSKLLTDENGRTVPGSIYIPSAFSRPKEKN